MKKNSAPKCSKHSDCFSIAATQLGPFPTSWYLRAQEAFGPLVRSEGVAHFGFTVRKEHFNFAVPPTRSFARPPERKIAPRQDPSRARPSSDHSDIIPPRGKTTRQRPLPSFRLAFKIGTLIPNMPMNHLIVLTMILTTTCCTPDHSHK